MIDSVIFGGNTGEQSGSCRESVGSNLEESSTVLTAENRKSQKIDEAQAGEFEAASGKLDVEHVFERRTVVVIRAQHL